MAPPRYTPIAAEDITSVKCEISHQPTDDMLGKPQHKPFLSKVDLLAVLTSLICFVFSFLVITPKLSWAWRLGLQHQLVLISFFLSVMSQNMKRIMPKILLMLEARWGRSILQNYQAILMNGSLGSHVDNIWRLVLNLLILLPIGLGVAYKQFLNGSSSIKINPNLNGYYGLNFPSLGDFAPMNNSIYLMMNVAAEFMTASSNDLVPFPPFRLPAPFGHNLLLLNNESAAVLDIPMTQYIESMQKEIGTNETWRLSASVNAYVSMHNQSITELRANDDFWNHTFNSSILYSFYLFDTKHNFGVLTGWSADIQGVHYLLGPYNLTSVPLFRTTETWMNQILYHFGKAHLCLTSDAKSAKANGTSTTAVSNWLEAIAATILHT